MACDNNKLLVDFFDKTVHETLKNLIISWYPYMTTPYTDAEALEITYFEFDFHQITSKQICLGFVDLIERWALVVDVKTFVEYLFEHSNLSRSFQTLYQRFSSFRRETRKPLI